MKPKEIDHMITPNKHKQKNALKGLVKYHNVFNKSSIIFTFFISLKYHKLLEKSSTFFTLFLDHAFLISSSGFAQTLQNFTNVFFLPLVMRK